MSATPGPNSLMNALDFFGKEDPEGVEKFKTIAFRALYEQRIDEEFRQTKCENEQLQKENAALSKELRDLQLSFDANVGDRERVLAFKSKRIEELNIKLKECEAINASLLQTINGGAEGIENAGSRAAMTALLQSGKPLFHALETCKEQDFRRLYDDKRAHCEQLVQQIQSNEALVQEMRMYQSEKEQVEEQIKQLQERIRTITVQKEDEVHFLERKLVFEHDRLRREKDSDIRACQEEMEKQMRMQLDVTTQRTIEENERMQLELRYQSSQLERLVKQVDQLMVENKQIQQEKRIFEDMNASLSKRIKFYEQLFAKMQQKDQLKNKHTHESPQTIRIDPVDSSSSQRFHSPRKPPLPSLEQHSLQLSPTGRQSAFSLGSCPPSPLQSPRFRYRGGRTEDEPNNRYSDDDESAFFDGGDQLNTVTDALEVHLQHREFARKQVDAALRYHLTHRQHQQQQLLKAREPKTIDRQKGVFMGQVPLVKKKIMLSKAAYSPSSYQRGRKMVEVSVRYHGEQRKTTLDSFIRQHASISPRQRTVPTSGEVRHESSSSEGATPASVPVILPELQPIKPPPLPSQDRSDMWKARVRPESPATARF